ncbi:MAG: hypothetical protein Q9213_001860 [Squamulea squamosa]
MKDLPQCQGINSPGSWRAISDAPIPVRPRGLDERSLSDITRSFPVHPLYSSTGPVPEEEHTATAHIEQPFEETQQSFFDTWKFCLLVTILHALWCYFCHLARQCATTARKRRLRDRPNLKRDKHQEKAAEAKKTSEDDERWFYINAFLLPQTVVAFVQSLGCDDKADKIDRGIICTIVVAYCFLASRLQRLTIDVQAEEDEEARPPEKVDLDMRTLRKYTRNLVKRLVKVSRQSAPKAAPPEIPQQQKNPAQHLSGHLLVESSSLCGCGQSCRHHGQNIGSHMSTTGYPSLEFYAIRIFGR